MRINRLSITGFGPYKERQRVDFDAFAADGIFLMGGKTGAGKSSILDAICFALYDSVPRYDGTRARLRSDHCGPDDPTLVTLEFTVGGERYRVERSPEFERPKKRGDGMTKAAAEARLFVSRNGEWEGLAARAVDVGVALAEIVGLSKDQFLQVILLAQNRFQQFLLAKNDERLTVLRTLFGTRRFLDYEEELLRRRRELSERIGATGAGLQRSLEQAAGIVASASDGPNDGDGPTSSAGESADAANEGERPERTRDPIGSVEGLAGEAIGSWLDDATAVVAELVAEAAASKTAAADAHQLADTAHDALLATHQRQQRRDAAALTLEELNASGPTIDAKRGTMKAAARAEVVWGFVTALAEAATAATTASESSTTALDDYIGRGGADVDDGALAGEIETHTKLLGALAEALSEERALPSLRAASEEARETLAVAESLIAASSERLAAIPRLIDSENDNLTALRVSAAATATASGALDRAQLAIDAARAAALSESALDSARIAELAAGKARTAASLALDELRERRLAGHAGELAAALIEGKPCSVCGSLSHPAPAELGTDAVTDEAIETAQATLNERTHAAEATSTAASQLTALLAEERAKAGDGTIDEHETRLAALRVELAQAQDAAIEANASEGRLLGLRAELAEAENRTAALRAERDASASGATSAETALRASEARIAEQRGDYASVTERSNALGSRLRSAQSLARARTSDAAAAAALATADAALRARLDEQGFGDDAEVRNAYRQSHERSVLEAEVRRHDEALAGARAILSDPELAALPSEPIELQESAGALLDAAAARDTALAAHATALARQESLDRIVAEARATVAASAGLLAEFAVVDRLAATVKGDAPNEKRMRLESFVLAAELEEIVAAANARLRQMSGGRYALEHDDGLGYRNTQSGLGLSILDSHTGRQRPTHSLSGGETFLASLALALGLAEVVTGRAGGITLDTLFIDEGFGSLDADTLEIAMATLDGLRTGGRTIGLISHVEAMKEQIHASLQVRVGEHGWSTISQSTAGIES